MIQLEKAPPKAKLTVEQTAEFEKLWLIERDKLTARHINGEFTRKKLKNKLFFARLRVLEKVKGVTESIIISEKSPLLPEIKDGMLVE